jgi:hypothetical protein
VCPPTKPFPTPSYEAFFGRQGPVKAESPEWRVELTKSEGAAKCPSQVALLFQARNKQTGATSQFKICNETAQVDEVNFINSTRALVLGRVGSSFPVASVVELPSGKVEDHFWCFLPMLSPHHRFLAFVKEFPPRPGPAVISDEYVVYDLTRTAEYNRPHFKPGVSYSPGWPVYPPGATNALGENVLPQGSPAHSRTSRYLFWLDDSKLSFTDFFQGQNLLIVANLSRGVRDVNVRTLALDPAQLVDLDQCKKSTAPSDFEVWSKEPAGLIRVAEIDPVPGKPGMACLHFVPSPCLRQTDLMVKLP